MHVIVTDIYRDTELVRQFFATSQVPTGEIVPVEPTFDEIFVRIIESYTASAAAETGIDAADLGAARDRRDAGDVGRAAQ